MGRWHETGNQDFDLVFRIIFFAIPSATICSERGMKGLLLQPGREEEGFRCLLRLVSSRELISSLRKRTQWGDFVPKLKRLVNQPSGRFNGSDEGGRDMSGNGIAPSGSSAAVSGYRISLVGGALDVSARLSTPEELELLVKVLEANKVLGNHAYWSAKTSA